MYLAFVLDMTVLFCLFDDQLTNLSPNSCILPNVLLLVSWQPAWSTSAKAVRAMQESFEYYIPIFIVPLRFYVRVVEENGRIHEDLKLKRRNNSSRMLLDTCLLFWS
ncbi:hypothetical protein Tco_1064843 [Tanacetum coccineum]